MTTKTFDRETLLDLTVNFVPLFILLFFVVVFAVMNPWGLGGLGRLIQFGLVLVPFALLAYLTYISGKAIVGSEKEDTVYYQGRSLVEGAEPKEEHEAGADQTDGEAAEGDEADAETN